MRAFELGTPGEMRSRLNRLVVDGIKGATALRVSDYADDGEQMETVGERLALVDDDADRIATLEVTAVEVRRFADVTWEFAQAEGEDFVNIEDWRAKHATFWNHFGAPLTDDSEIACIRFVVVNGAA